MTRQRIIQPIVRRIAAVLMFGSGLWMGLPLFPLVNCAASTPFHTVSVRSDGVLLKNRRSFFPLGLYHVSWDASPATQRQHLQEIAAAGFNVVHASAKDWESYARFLRQADSLGISVISEHHFDPVAFVQRFKNEPAILAWNLADDVDNGRWTPAQVLTLHRQLRAADPNHPTYISGYSKGLSKFAQCANILGRQSYPIRQHTTAELSSVSIDMAETAKALLGRPQGVLFANLQAFAWSTAKPGQQGSAPDVSEMRNMTYQALLGGAKGILYYTYYDDTWYLPGHPKLWQEIKTLNQQVKSLAPWFLEGHYRPLAFSGTKLKGGIWTLNQRHLLVVVNTSTQHSEPAFVQGSWIQIKSIQPLYQAPMAQRFSESKLRLSLPPKAVQIYEIH